jgi:SAM-dependent methyltransferase
LKSFKERADELWWFNAVDFGDFQARGRDKPEAPPNASLYGTYDLLCDLNLKGLRCIDIGSGSGVVALGMKALGADYVLAADTKKYDTVELAMEITGEDIDYRQIPFERLCEHEELLGSFDVVVSSGLMYHLLSPFELVYVARKLLKAEGIFVLQSLTTTEQQTRAGAYLNTARNINGDPSTFFVPSCAAVAGMLRAGCFDIRGERELTYKYGFHAWVSVAKTNPDEVPERADNLKKMHDWAYRLGENFGGYNLREMLTHKETASIPKFETERFKKIDENLRDCRFPYNPTQLINPVGVIR